VGRAIPGSSFERGDDERRTWDEMGLGDEPFDDYDDSAGGDYEPEFSDEDYEPHTLDEWLWGEAAPLTRATQSRLLDELDRRIGELEDALYYQRMAIAAGDHSSASKAAADEADLAELVAFRRGNSDLIDVTTDEQAPTREVEPAAVPRRLGPVRQLERAISEKLTPDEMLHWQELQKGTKQTVIAEKLGISQGAVSKRERAPRECIDAISVETIGRRYPAKRIDRGLWARQGRRRNKSASRQR
jgi:hypothetical protein